MRTPILAAALLAAAPAGAQTTYHVDDSAAPGGDGLSWRAPLPHLRDALALAGPGDTVLVAQGLYRPDRDDANPGGTGDRDATFLFGDEVVIEGGYLGLGPGMGDPGDRDVDLYETVLSGDLLGDDLPDFANRADNARHVVTTDGFGEGSVLDGVTIRAGNASDGNNAQRRGAGVYHFGGFHHYRDCTIVDNDAFDEGGGMYVVGPLSLENCHVAGNRGRRGGGVWAQANGPFPHEAAGTTFENNLALEHIGGGIWCESGDLLVDACTFSANDRDGVGIKLGTATITNTQFIANERGFHVDDGTATIDACLFIDNGGANNFGDAPTITNSTFINNAGSAILAETPHVAGCQFLSNEADHGAAIRTGGAGETRIESSTFFFNKAAQEGGAVYYDGSPDPASLVVQGCVFLGNIAANDNGGALFSAAADDTRIVACEFTHNSAFDGGAVRVSSGEILVRDSTFDENLAGEGGALNVGNGVTEATLLHSRFHANQGDEGGAVYSEGAHLVVVGSLFTGNVALGDRAGAVRVSNADLGLVYGSTFYANLCPDGNAGGLYGPIAVDNSVLWANADKNGRRRQSQINSSLDLIRASCIEGFGPRDDRGNFDEDPRFIDPAGPDRLIGTTDDDLRLRPDSPCVDAADPELTAPDEYDLDADGDTDEPIPYDLAGAPRVADDPLVANALPGPPVDIGALEHQLPALVEFALPEGLPAFLPINDATDVPVEIHSAGADPDPATAFIALRPDGADWETIPMQHLGDDAYLAPALGAECARNVELYLGILTTDGELQTFPAVGELAPYARVSADDLVIALADDFETDQGWQAGAAGDDATTGIWVRDDPVGTSAQPEIDYTPDPGVACFFTGQGVKGGDVGVADVDEGTTTLTSPPFDLTDAAVASVRYARWYVNAIAGQTPDDVFTVEASGDDGATWHELATLGPDDPDIGPAWHVAEHALLEIIEPTTQVRLRFVASDLGEPSLVEAAIDDVAVHAVICHPACPADLNGDGLLNVLDFVAFQIAWQNADPIADCDANATFDVLDFVCFQQLFVLGCD